MDLHNYPYFTFQMMENLLLKLIQENFGASLEALHQLEEEQRLKMIILVRVMQESFTCKVYCT